MIRNEELKRKFFLVQANNDLIHSVGLLNFTRIPQNQTATSTNPDRIKKL
jgi:hypothetical protein